MKRAASTGGLPAGEKGQIFLEPKAFVARKKKACAEIFLGAF